MSQVVACPNCQTRYNLPESAIGKRVKCKSCGKPFSASVGASRAKQRQATRASRGSGVEVAELEKMGIGTIKAQPEIFAAEIAPGPDPLQNHVVHDPGFSLAHTSGNGTDNPATVVEDDFENVVENPHLKGSGGTSKSISEEVAERRRREEKILKAYATPSSGAAPKRKKKSSQVGITRLGYFFCNFALFAFLVGMTMIGTFFAGLKIQETSANPLEAGIMFLVVGLMLMIVMGVVSTLLVRSRVENMAFSSPIWVSVATGISCAPYVLYALAIASGFVFGPLAIAFLSLAGLLVFPVWLVGCCCIVLPPNFGQTMTLDVVSYIWIGIIALSLLSSVISALMAWL